MEDTACKKGGMEEKPSEITVSLSKGNRKKVNGEENPTIESTKKDFVNLPALQVHEKSAQKDLYATSNAESHNSTEAETLLATVNTQVEGDKVIPSAVKLETPPVAGQTVHTVSQISVAKKKNNKARGTLIFAVILIGITVILGTTVYGRTSILIANDLLTGSYVDALQKVNTLPKDNLGMLLHGKWIDALAEYVEYEKPKTVDELLVIAQIEKLAEDITDFKSPRFNDALNVYSGIQSDQSRYQRDLGIKFLEDIYSMCGTKGCGKILLVQEYRSYLDHEAVCEIAEWAMKYMPLEYFPTSVDEVDYVVVLSYDFKEYEDGFYLSETVPLQEYATIYIYSVRDSANIWTSSVIEGPPPGSFSYINEPPEYHSGGSPDVEVAFIEAMKVIMK